MQSLDFTALLRIQFCPSCIINETHFDAYRYGDQQLNKVLVVFFPVKNDATDQLQTEFTHKP
ncbi:MAG: hypothetical protein CMG96_01775 [Marinovum sp.]|nr:hypothetical protein [Marinovum sp.]